MILTPSNIKQWARSLGEEVTGYVGARTLKNVVLHDRALKCSACGNWFSSAGDMEADDPETDTDRGECWWDRWGYALPGAVALGEGDLGREAYGR